uniref:Reverse transcriptase domain-containing protein n=1 Tax=Tanacetum cinerariifolium TaxID=118510 RepID=A0A699GH26_TANCI|nr:hypothetical protein [Tanacetum cinerariifolium]
MNDTSLMENIDSNTTPDSSDMCTNEFEDDQNADDHEDECVDSCAFAQKKDAQSPKTTKRYISIEKKSDSKNHGRHIPIGQRFSPNNYSDVYLKTTPPRSGLTWKPTGRIFTYDGLRWIPTRKIFETCNNTNDSAIRLGKEIYTHNTVICANSSSLSGADSVNLKPRKTTRTMNPETGDTMKHRSIYGGGGLWREIGGSGSVEDVVKGSGNVCGKDGSGSIGAGGIEKNVLSFGKISSTFENIDEVNVFDNLLSRANCDSSVENGIRKSKSSDTVPEMPPLLYDDSISSPKAGLNHCDNGPRVGFKEVKVTGMFKIVGDGSKLDRGGFGDNKLKFVPTSLNGEGRVVFVLDDVLEKEANKWSMTVLEEVIVNQGYYCCNFKSHEGMQSVVKNGPCLVNNMSLFVRKWEPGLSMSKLDTSKVLVLVEVDAVRGLTDSVEVWYRCLGKYMVLDVEYVWRPPLCEHCKMFGHYTKGCSKRAKEEIVKNVNTGGNVKSSTGSGNGMRDEEGWQNIGNRRENKGSGKTSNVDEVLVTNDVNIGVAKGKYEVGKGEMSKTGNDAYESGIENANVNVKVNDTKENDPVVSKGVDMKNRFDALEGILVLEDVFKEWSIEKVKFYREEWKKRVKRNVTPEDSLKLNLDSLQSRITEVSRSCYKNAKVNGVRKVKEAKATMGEKAKGLYGQFYDQSLRAEFLLAEDLKWEIRKTKVDLFLLSKQPLTNDLKDVWSDDMLKYYLGRCDDIRSDRINRHFDEDDGVRKGCRIRVGWDRNVIGADLLSQDRKPLWGNLRDHNRIVDGESWVVLNAKECSNSFSVRDKDMDGFRRCLESLNLEDIFSFGSQTSVFRFMNFLADKELFLPTVKDNWSIEIEGFKMFVHAKRLKNMKKYVRSLNRENVNVFEKTKVLREELKKVRQSLDRDPDCIHLREEELLYNNAYREAVIDEEKVLKQKTKVEWLKECDQNTACFHKVLKDDKAAGPNGFTSKFFKKAWKVVGDDVCAAVREFFVSGKLLGEFNANLIILVPKLQTPLKVSDYRPILCCNVVYKCISKVVSNRLKEGLGSIVDSNQSALIPGRQISDNILLMQKFMRDYNMEKGASRCAFKIDIQKVYDTVNWDFLKTSLLYFGFYASMIHWILCGMKDVCRPKSQGLGLKPLKTMNEALMLKHLWNIVSNMDSLWVKWVYGSRIKGKSFWDVKEDSLGAWSWNQIFKLRDKVRNYIGYKIGNGKGCFIWFDRWHSNGLLNGDNNEWIWPDDWGDRFNDVTNVLVLVLVHDKEDSVVWMNKNNEEVAFSVKEARKILRTNILKMDNATLKSALKSSSSAADGLAAKVCNIKGKIRMPVRNVSFTRPLNDIANAQHVKDGSNKVQSMEDDSQHDGNVHLATNTMNDVHGHSVGTTSFASVLQHKHTKKKVVVSELRNDERVEGAVVVIPMEVVKEFSTREGMEKVLESGPWLVRLVPLILNIWSPNAKSTKDEVDEEGFTTVNRKKSRTAPKKQVAGIRLSKPKPNMVYRRVEKGESDGTGLNSKHVDKDPSSSTKGNGMDLKNSFDSLGGDTNDNWFFAPDYSSGIFNVIMKAIVKIEVRHMINENNLAVCAILESHIASSRLDVICKRVFRHWYLALNSSSCFKGTRIILGWNADIVDTSIISQSDQVMHTRIWIKAERKELFCSFIYAHNQYTHRRGLWDSLCMHKCFINNRPWCILGDFNAALNIEDASAGSSFMDISMRDFKECIEEIELIDVPRFGLQFTWNQKPQGSNGILKKLDRVMANVEFSNEFIGNYAVFQPYGISDHSLEVLRIPLLHKFYPKPFKFANVITTFPRFKEVVKEGNLHDNVNKLIIEMARVQQDLDADPTNQDLRDDEAVYVRAFTKALIMQERFLKQKAKIEWLKVGDSNSAYFHKSVRGRTSRNRIDVVIDFGGDLVTGDGVPVAFALDMIKHVTAQEVKEAIFSMGNDKSPGPDGYTACFFKECWDIVTSDVVCAIKESLKGLISLNQSAFVPGRRISDNIFLTQELMHNYHLDRGLLGRRISDNIFLTQELMHNYHLDRGPSRYDFKIDIQKAYDTVDWGFLKEVLLAFGFHVRMVDWIMEYVTTTSFSLSINGTLHGYFKGKRGLRQGDPLSPYLFTLIMDVLTLMLRCKARDSDGFRYHRYCSDLEIINLCFADDLFIFAHGDPYSAKVIIEAIEEFKNASGLTASLPKSTAYFCNVLNHTKLSILQILPFEEGRLPVKYLGVPLVSSRLVFRDCKELVDRIHSRINDWKNKSLSAAGRLQLVRSVLGSMHVYWASVFIQPSRILLDIEQLMRGFLWCHGEMKQGRAKVAWEVVCLPKNEGGLGKESLWVKWIHQYKLRGRHFFDVPYHGCMTWGWRKLLQLRPLIRDHIRFRIGDGATCSFWFDRWSTSQPLVAIVSNRDIHRVGFYLYSKVKDAIYNREWPWHVDWFSKYPLLNSVVVPTLSAMHDRLEWRDRLEIVKPFSVNAVWNYIRPRDAVVWDSVKSLAGLPNVIGSISISVDLLIPFTKQRSARSVVAKLVVAACSYYIWQERNLRLFMNQKRSHSQAFVVVKVDIPYWCHWKVESSSDMVFKLTVEIVRLKLLGLKINYSSEVEKAAKIRNLPLKGIKGGGGGSRMNGVNDGIAKVLELELVWFAHVYFELVAVLEDRLGYLVHGDDVSFFRSRADHNESLGGVSSGMDRAIAWGYGWSRYAWLHSKYTFEI